MRREYNKVEWRPGAVRVRLTESWIVLTPGQAGRLGRKLQQAADLTRLGEEWRDVDVL